MNRWAQVEPDHIPFRGVVRPTLKATHRPVIEQATDHEYQTRRFPPESAALVKQLAQAESLPCRDNLETFDAAVDKPQSYAAMQTRQLCFTCPEFDACSLLARLIKPTSGVWAGKVMSHKRR